MSDVRATTRAVVRGEKPWTALVDAGVPILRTHIGWQFGPEKWPVYQVTPADLACGVRAHGADSAGLIEWGYFVYATDLVEFEELGRLGLHGAAMELLWDIAFRNLGPVAALGRAERLQTMPNPS